MTQKVALGNSTTDTQKNLVYETEQTEPGLVTFYNIWLGGNGVGLLFQPWSLHEAITVIIY